MEPDWLLYGKIEASVCQHGSACHHNCTLDQTPQLEICNGDTLMFIKGNQLT